MLNLNLEVVVLLLAGRPKHKTSQSTINGQSGQKTFTTETNSSEISDLLKGEKLFFISDLRSWTSILICCFRFGFVRTKNAEQP